MPDNIFIFFNLDGEGQRAVVIADTLNDAKRIIRTDYHYDDRDETLDFADHEMYLHPFTGAIYFD